MKNLLNLYTEELRERPVPYGFPWLVSALVVTLGLMMIYGLWTEQRLAGLSTEQHQLSARQEALQSSIAALEGQLVNKDRLEAMEREMAHLREANAQREILLAELQWQVKHPTEGFSRQLRGLAAAHGQGVWLTRIQLTNVAGGQDASPPSTEVRLFGRMHQGQQLPRYMDALAEVEAFRGLHFNSMQVLRLEGDDKTIAFLISTRADDQLEAGKRP